VNELAKRVLFALVGAPLTIALIYFGGWVLAAALGAIAALGAWELCRMTRTAGNQPLDTVAIVIAACVPLMVHATYLGVFHVTITIAVLIYGLAVRLESRSFHSPSRSLASFIPRW
jgi:CDP-diglyceride synthetase